MAKTVTQVKRYTTPAAKRTSQGLRHRPKSKHARRNWKRYRGQGRPR